MNFELIYTAGALTMILVFVSFALFSYLYGHMSGVNSWEAVFFGTFAALIWPIIAFGYLCWAGCKLLQKVKRCIVEKK